jgi:hypothetical protein
MSNARLLLELTLQWLPLRRADLTTRPATPQYVGQQLARAHTHIADALHKKHSADDTKELSLLIIWCLLCREQRRASESCATAQDTARACILPLLLRERS